MEKDILYFYHLSCWWGAQYFATPLIFLIIVTQFVLNAFAYWNELWVRSANLELCKPRAP